MNTTTSNKTLLVDALVFMAISVGIWVLIVIAQSAFPGTNTFPIFARFALLLLAVIGAVFLNKRFFAKNQLSSEILKLQPRLIQDMAVGIVIATLLVVVLWGLIYLIHPYNILIDTESKPRLSSELISYTLGNTLEELIFRGFLLIALVKAWGKFGGIAAVSVLFGLFHLQGTGLTIQGLSMVLTTATMSLLFISVIYYTKSIWTAVSLHITGNFLLHSLGFDGASTGVLHIVFKSPNTNDVFFTIIYEFVVLLFALIVFKHTRKSPIF